MAQTTNQRQSGPFPAITRQEYPVTNHLMWRYSASASVHPVVSFPIGVSLIGVSWPSHSTSVTGRFQAGWSSSVPARFVRKSDDSGQLRIFSTSSTAPVSIFVPDLAVFNQARLVFNKKSGS